MSNAPCLRRFSVASLVLTAAVAAAPPLAATAAPSRPERVESEAEYVFELRQGPWRVTQATTLRVLYDRPGQRLRVEHPAATLVVRNGTLTATMTGVEGFAIETPIDAASYEAVTAAVPMINEPRLVDLALLAADDPASALAGGPAAFTTGADGTRTLTGQAGVWTLDPVNGDGLVPVAMLALPDGQFDPGPASMSYRYTTLDADPAFADDDFEIDTTGLTVVDSFQSLMQAMQGGGAGGPGAGGGGSPRVGQDAPDFTLARLEGGEVTLSELDNRVVVLDFWATWCPPCVEGMPKVQAVADWAAEGGLPVEVFAVNLQETPDQVRRFMADHGLTLPVLMDDQGDAANVYGVSAIPTTVVIAYGKVKQVYVGLAPNLEATLKSEIEAAVKPAPEES